MKKILTIALLLGSLTANAQLNPQHKQVKRATITCKVRYNNVQFNKVQVDSMFTLHKQGYILDEVVTVNGNSFIKLHKIGK